MAQGDFGSLERTPYEKQVMRENFGDRIESALDYGDLGDKLAAIGHVLLRILTLVEEQTGATSADRPY
jgi:hypothetical protein